MLERAVPPYSKGGPSLLERRRIRLHSLGSADITSSAQRILLARRGLILAGACSTTHRTGGPPVPKRRFHVQWVHIGMQGGGVCIRKISGFVKVTSRSSPTKVRSQIFYVCTFEGCALPYRGFQLPPCPGVLSVSALRAGALSLAPACTGLRTGRGAGLT